jgi:hypothetical protein
MRDLIKRHNASAEIPLAMGSTDFFLCTENRGQAFAAGVCIARQDKRMDGGKRPVYSPCGRRDGPGGLTPCAQGRAVRAAIAEGKRLDAERRDDTARAVEQTRAERRKLAILPPPPPEAEPDDGDTEAPTDSAPTAGAPEVETAANQGGSEPPAILDDDAFLRELERRPPSPPGQPTCLDCGCPESTPEQLEHAGRTHTVAFGTGVCYAKHGLYHGANADLRTSDPGGRAARFGPRTREKVLQGVATKAANQARKVAELAAARDAFLKGTGSPAPEGICLGADCTSLLRANSKGRLCSRCRLRGLEDPTLRAESVPAPPAPAPADEPRATPAEVVPPELPPPPPAPPTLPATYFASVAAAEAPPLPMIAREAHPEPLAETVRRLTNLELAAAVGEYHRRLALLALRGTDSQ